MTSPARDYTLIRSRIETDPYNPVLVEDLINGLNDWRSVQDIVRLTFKALSDVVKSQGASLKELELQVPAKATKSEISQCIMMKNNYTETIRTVSELKSAIEGKMSIDDVYSIVEEKVSRNDLQYLLGTKASYEELRSSLSEKADIREVQTELRALRAMIEEMNEENYRKFQQCASKRDLQQFETLIESKANKDEVTEALDEKANKQSVANALHRKSNKADMDALLQSKVETSEYVKLFEFVQEINSQVLMKAEKNEMAAAQTAKKDSETKIFSYISNLENFTTSMKTKLEDLQNLLSMKSEVKDIEKLAFLIGKKADCDSVKDSISLAQREFKETFQTYKYDSLVQYDTLSEKYGKLESAVKKFQMDFTQVHESIRNVSESTRANLEEGVKSVHHYTGSKLEEISNFRIEIERLYREIDAIKHLLADKVKVDKDLHIFSRQLQHSSEDLKDLILRKEKELILMIDKKPGIHEITSLILENTMQKSHKFVVDEGKISSFRNDDNLQKDLSRIRLELDDRISSFISEQSGLNEMLCSENCVARWLWRSGEVRSSFAVPWEVESVNTCPENYYWEVGSTSVIAVAPGLYEVAYGVFARKKPNIEVLVNGQAIFIEFNCAGKNWGRHNDGNVVAASVIDFVTLPARAKISMTYSGEPGAEGFIALRKL